MLLIQIVLPITDAVREGVDDLNASFAIVKNELMDLIDGVSACLRSATDVWTGAEGEDVPSGVRIEVIATTFDRRWWRAYARKLARRFGQRKVCVRVESFDASDVQQRFEPGVLAPEAAAHLA